MPASAGLCQGLLLKLVKSLQREYLLWVLLGALAVFSVVDSNSIQRYPSLVDGGTTAALAGLLILTTGVEASGYLAELANRVIHSVHNERRCDCARTVNAISRAVA